MEDPLWQNFRSTDKSQFKFSLDNIKANQTAPKISASTLAYPSPALMTSEVKFYDSNDFDSTPQTRTKPPKLNTMNDSKNSSNNSKDSKENNFFYLDKFQSRNVSALPYNFQLDSSS